MQRSHAEHIKAAMRYRLHRAAIGASAASTVSEEEGKSLVVFRFISLFLAHIERFLIEL